MPAQTVAGIKRARIPRDTVTMARRLLGKALVRNCRNRNRSLFRDRGHAYVYLCYGTSHMLDVSRETEGVGAAVQHRTRPVPLMRCMLHPEADSRPRPVPLLTHRRLKVAD